MTLKQYNTWERYFDPKHPKHKYQVARHTWFMDRIRGPRLLDVGCSGGLALFLAGKHADIKELHGVDICEDTITAARNRLSCYRPAKYVNLLLGKAEFLPKEDDYFDGVMCGETLEHVADDKKAASELYRVTKKGGILLISVPKEGHLSTEHIRLYTKTSLNALIMSAGFNIAVEDEMLASARGYYLLLKAVKV